VTTTIGGTTVLRKIFYKSVLVGDQDKALASPPTSSALTSALRNPTPDRPRFLTVRVEGDDFQLGLWPGTPG
jgi:hypothetical protein